MSVLLFSRTTGRQTLYPASIVSGQAFGTLTRTGGARAGEGGAAVAGTDISASDGNLFDNRVSDGVLFTLSPTDGNLSLVRVSDALAA
jgi:hypothetical protein